MPIMSHNEIIKSSKTLGMTWVIDWITTRRIWRNLSHCRWQTCPCNLKMVRANEAPFTDKYLKRSIRNRSRLWNRYLNTLSLVTWQAYKSQRNACTKLLMLWKCEYFNKLDTKLISDNKTFRKSIKPFFSDKFITHKKLL